VTYFLSSARVFFDKSEYGLWFLGLRSLLARRSDPPRRLFGALGQRLGEVTPSPDIFFGEAPNHLGLEVPFPTPPRGDLFHISAQKQHPSLLSPISVAALRDR